MAVHALPPTDVGRLAPPRFDYFALKIAFGIMACTPLVPSTSCVMFEIDRHAGEAYRPSSRLRCFLAGQKIDGFANRAIFVASVRSFVPVPIVMK